MLKLRLTRMGSKKKPSYRVVAMEALTKRDGKAVAYLGNYFPLEDSRVVLKEEEIVKHLMNGAQPTRTVKSILVKAGVWAKFEEAKKN
ncbi:30S ribosomal protein S16 [Propionigenium maris DSM 9537]|jgi:small subunit ribosomal protein S16|uniref:Small ribosomal subunit protein bS16 n=1 Tax=Propionigenium maris DSM 9537 TaxID=1123000 RepID=A0A9W6GLN5_9FUSO|nr:30S ribosomal protein S16 [Propionigenium maris]GLI56129.1 30S ribosomal protein S16 [Propionigenium maris DSM 9537]